MDSFNFSQYQNIVIKVGSSLIAPDGRSCSTQYCLPLASFIKKCQQLGKKVTLVTSGAVAAGVNTLKIDHSELTLAKKQACAAVGQAKLINHWQRFFDNHVAQLLLTADDIKHPKRQQNARKTIEQLHQYAILPIVNENDTVATAELKFGDNDNLAAQVATLINADLLIICSDVDGVYNDNPHQNPQAELIPYIEQITDKTLALGKPTHNAQATGGMVTKLGAAQFASKAGINTIICNGKSEAYTSLLEHKITGTFISSNKPYNQQNKPGINIINV